MKLGVLCVALLSWAMGLAVAGPARAAEEAPYEFNAELSLTGGCGTSTADPVPDPGCPEKKPPKPFLKPLGIAVDSFGDEYVASYSSEGAEGRIDVFSPKGVFIAEVKDGFGPKSLAVDSKGTLYTFDKSSGHPAEFARYKPVTYQPAEAKIEYGSREVIATEAGPFAGGLAIDSNDHVFVAWSTSIKEYSSAAEGNSLLETITHERLFSSVFLAIDKQRRRLYASTCPNDITKCWVLVFDADTNELLKEIKGPNTTEEGFASGKGWISIAVDEETGDFFVGDLEITKNVYQFNEDYEHISTLAISPALFEGGEPMQIAVSNAPKGTKNKHYLFVPSLKGRALALAPPKCQPPAIEGAEATGIGENEAELQVLVKPSGCATAYRFEYLSQQEYEEAGNSFTGAKIAGEGTVEPVEQEAEVKAAISGLQPGTAYRARISAENEVGLAEPEEIAFATYSEAPIFKECPEALRNTYSTLLPDCRAYELVTPADTNGRPPHGIEDSGEVFSTVEVSPSGNALSFLTSGGVLPGTEGAGGLAGDQYRASRSASGWNTQSASPSGSLSTLPIPGSTSPDQGYSFWIAIGEGPAVIDGEGHYVRYPDGRLEFVGRGSLGTDPTARGKLITENGTHIVFETHAESGNQAIQLEPDAPPIGTNVVYDRTADEVTHVVSLLPGNETPKEGENAEYAGASADGEGIAFRIGTTLYLRVGNITTYEIGTGVEFAGVSEGGKRIFYLEGGDLFAFDAESEEAIPFSEVGNAVPVNVAPDGVRAYFVSTTAIPGSGENPNGASAEAGKENLYLSEEGAVRFVAPVTERDVIGESTSNGQVDGLGLWASGVTEGRRAIDPSRLSPDGSVLLFQSRADLDGYSHEGVPEIYRYDSAGGRLHCISCIPTKTPAGDGAGLQSLASPKDVAPPLSGFGFVPNLRADGKRAVFQSTEALVSTDNDNVQDVYEWEEQGAGSCTRAGGCLYLISSGHSEKSNYLYAVSASGDDIFFTTSDVLVEGDGNTISIYDARVDGGFPEVAEKECEGEGCRPDLTPPPDVPRPESHIHLQPEPVPLKHCPKGKRKVKRHGKEVCVKKKHHRKHANKKGAGK